MSLIDIQFIHEKTKAVKESINKVIIGKSKEIDLILTALLAGGHVLLEDVPGTGKTMMAKALARSFDAGFCRIQFTPDLLPSDITGINYYNQKISEFTFREGPVFTNILLADEINRATPRTQSSLLECMEERQVTVDGQTRLLNPPFFVMATQNPVETGGTYRLPEAQLDRFLMQISLGYPTVLEEMDIMGRFMKESPLEELNPVCSKEELIRMQQEIKDVYVHELLLKYIADITQATRKQETVLLGASPRGTLALLRAAQSHAAVNGRDYVVPEDIKELAAPVLAHRLILRGNVFSAQSGAALLGTILTGITVPTEQWKD